MKLTMKARATATTLMLCAGIAVVVAQQQGGPGGPGGQGQMRRGPANSFAVLIRMSTVQKELQMTADQIQKVNALQPPQGGPGGQGQPPQGGPPQGGPGGQQGGFDGGPGGPPPDGQPGGPPPQGFRDQGGPPPQGQGRGPGDRGAHGPDGGPLAKILSAEQMARLKQLGLQFEAPMSFLQPDVAKQLGLDEDQRQQIDAIIREHMRPPQQGGQRPDWKTMMANKASAFKEAFAKLNDNAQQAWTRLTGKPFSNWEEPKRP